MGQWTSLPLMGSARYQATAVGVNGLLYVIGGYGYNATGPAGGVEVYNPATNTWRTVTAMPTARWALGAGAVNGRIYTVGGLAVGNLGEVTLADNQVYIP
jgi:N-acetylneuraminic acid mutarotase